MMSLDVELRIDVHDFLTHSNTKGEYLCLNEMVFVKGLSVIGIHQMLA